MLRHITLIAYLSLVGISCSKAKQTECATGIDPRTGACVAAQNSETAATINMLQEQLDAQTRQTQQLIQQNQDKQEELQRLRQILNNPNATPSQKEQVIEQLGALGIQILVPAGAKVGQAGLEWLDRWLDEVLEPDPATTPPPPVAPNALGGG